MLLYYILYQHRQVVKTETTNIFIELLNYLVEYKKNTLPRFIIMIDFNLKKKVHRLLVRVAGCMARRRSGAAGSGSVVVELARFRRSQSCTVTVSSLIWFRPRSSRTRLREDCQLRNLNHRRQVFYAKLRFLDEVVSTIIVAN